MWRIMEAKALVLTHIACFQNVLTLVDFSWRLGYHQQSALGNLESHSVLWDLN